jgi:serine/threonine-protein kinase
MSDAVVRLNSALSGRYRVERQLGAGGMATVYLASDLKHDRKVALKVLKPELAAVVGAERFLAEIRTTANLQHPHVLPLHDSGEADGLLFYVMPFIEGETLRDRLDREHQLPVDEAVRIATNVAEALDYAHRHGVIHRDIKPANILLVDGKPVVADFGIALAVTSGSAGRMTETGLSLGTPHYMSPEQATGDAHVGPATDIWALGCVLYEMLAGEPPYAASTPQAVLGKIITAEPPSVVEVRKSVPPNVDAAIRKALEKVPADRFGSAAALADALENSAFIHDATARIHPRVASGTWSNAPRPWSHDGRSIALLATAAALVVVAAWGWNRPSESLAVDIVRFTLSQPPGVRLEPGAPLSSISISRDGRQLVYQGRTANSLPQLYLHSLDQMHSVPLPGTERGQGPVISNDGRWVAFRTDDRDTRLQRVPILGGAPVTIVDAPSAILGWTWDDRDQLIFGTADGGLFLVSSGGGEPQVLTTPDRARAERDHTFPYYVEGRNAVVFTISTTQSATATSRLTSGQLAVLDLASREVTPLGVQGVSPHYSRTGHITYALPDGSVRSVPFDASSLAVTGAAVPLMEGIAVRGSGAADIDISADGRLVYVLGTGAAVPRLLTWVERSGSEEPIPAPTRSYAYPRISPEGRRVALDVRDEEASIWMWDLVSATPTRITSGAYPTWAPDGGRIAYNAGSEILQRAPNNTGTTEVLVGSQRGGGAGAPNPYFITPDGIALVYREQANPETDDDLVMISLVDDSVLWRLNGDYVERNAELSPNGEWMAYQSDESDSFEIYLRPFPDVHADQITISNNGGIYPVWSRDGHELFYLEPADPLRLIAVRFEMGVGERLAFSRQVVMEWPYYAASEGRTFDVSADGRFLAVKEPEATTVGSPEIHVVLNWFEELRQRMGEP